MSGDPRDPDYWSNDDRAVRRRSELTGWDRLFTDVVYYGLGQVLLLCAPMLWLVYQTPFVGEEATAACGVALVVVPSLVGLFRGGRLRVGRPWPPLSERTFGVGGGYYVFSTRAVYLSSTLALAAYGGASVGVAAGSSLLAGAVGGVVAAGGVVLLPSLTAETARGYRGRAVYYAVALAAASVGGSVFVVDVGDPTAALVVALYALLALVDCRPLLPGAGE